MTPGLGLTKNIPPSACMDQPSASTYRSTALGWSMQASGGIFSVIPRPGVVSSLNIASLNTVILLPTRQSSRLPDSQTTTDTQTCISRLIQLNDFQPFFFSFRDQRNTYRVKVQTGSSLNIVFGSGNTKSKRSVEGICHKSRPPTDAAYSQCRYIVQKLTHKA